MRDDLSIALLDSMAVALEYPTDKSERAATYAASKLSEIDADAARAFGKLSWWLCETARWDAEELYTRLFDLKPTCSLHVGFHVYGEAYQRGALLAGLVGELRAAGVDPGVELPDYLPNVLRLWGRIPHDDDARLLHDRIIAPGIANIAKELRRIDTPWAQAVCALEALFPLDPDAIDERTQAQRNWEALHA